MENNTFSPFIASNFQSRARQKVEIPNYLLILLLLFIICLGGEEELNF